MMRTSVVSTRVNEDSGIDTSSSSPSFRRKISNQWPRVNPWLLFQYSTALPTTNWEDFSNRSIRSLNAPRWLGIFHLNYDEILVLSRTRRGTDVAKRLFTLVDTHESALHLPTVVRDFSIKLLFVFNCVFNLCIYSSCCPSVTLTCQLNPLHLK